MTNVYGEYLEVVSSILMFCCFVGFCEYGGVYCCEVGVYVLYCNGVYVSSVVGSGLFLESGSGGCKRSGAGILILEGWSAQLAYR